MVVKKTWPALQSCKHQHYESKDPFSRLPDELVFVIMSFLTIEEAARTCVLSHRWNYLWRHLPVLIFKDFDAMKRMFEVYEDDESIPQERSRFLRRVNRVLEGHLGQTVDELRVVFDLNKRCQSVMNNKWLAFALAKQVKRLELDFSKPLLGTAMNSLPKWHLPSNNSTFYCLHSLSLTYVNITTKGMDALFSSCMLLENLCIQRSSSLRCVRALGLPLQLKHFEVSLCPRLRSINISAPKLLSFTHGGNPIKLNIENASLLSRLSFGTTLCDQEVVSYALDSLSKYCSQLEYLSWSVRIWHAKLNLGINKPPALTNLKHLEINITGFCTQSLFGWADLMEASPLLERLTLKFITMMCVCKNIRQIKKRRVRPLKSLKTLELDHRFGSVGCSIDLEVATYVVENSIMLKDVIVVLSPEQCSYSNEEDRVAQYKTIVPQGVKLTLNRLNHY